MRKKIALIITIAMILSLMPFSISSAASKAPAKVKITSVKAKKATPKKGKATVTVKWKKVKGATKYQVFVKRIDGKWKLSKTVKGSKKKAKVTAYVGKNYIRVRAVKKTGDTLTYGSYSKVKAVTVKSKKTVQSYMKSHAAERKKIEKNARAEGVVIKFRANDIIYIYDITDDVEAELAAEGYDESDITAAMKTALKKELKKELSKKLSANSGKFKTVRKQVGSAIKVGGVRVIVRYNYEGKLLLKKVF